MHERPLRSIENTSTNSFGRRLLLLSLIFGVPLLILAAFAYLHFAGRSALAAAVAEADALEPDGWRMVDIEAHRTVLPDTENGALQLLRARKLLPEPWPQFPAPAHAVDDPTYIADYRQLLENSLSDLQPPIQLNDVQIAGLRAELKRAEPALIEGRKLASMPRGRFQIKLAKDFISTLLPDVQKTRDIANLLRYDTFLRAQDGDIPGALDSCHAGLNTARIIGDEPFLISQLVRIAGGTVALRELERVLAQGQPSEGSLAHLQRALEMEAAEPLLLHGLRGERGGMDGLMELIEAGDYKVSQLRGLFSTGGPKNAFAPEEVQFLWLFITARAQRAALLRYMTEMVEIAKLPVEEQLNEFKRYQPKDNSLVLRMLAPACSKVASAYHRYAAECRCAALALAVERYRLAHGCWPDSLSQVVPEYLPKVPTDPFDGAPIRFGPFDQGVVIYSVGFDGVDNGGNILPSPYTPGSDLGFRLWDVPHRRQLALPFTMPEREAQTPAPNGMVGRPEEK